MTKKVAVLTSGMGLGAFTAALNLKNELDKAGDTQSDLYIYEEYLPKLQKDNVKKYQKAFHEDKRMAVAGHKLMCKMEPKVDMEFVGKMLSEWKRKGYREFVLLSGNWLPIVSECVKMEPDFGEVVCVRLDCENTPSWEKAKQYDGGFQTVWLLGKSGKEVKYKLYQTASVPFERRERRCYIHGGGWGMGTYLEEVDEISRHIPLDVLIHSPNDVEAGYGQNRYYIFPQNWNPWDAGRDGKYGIPPLNEYDPDEKKVKKDKTAEGLEIMKNNIGMISKPGGGTIIDCLASETPLIFIEPISKHEQANMDYYIDRGLAVSLEQWKKSDYSAELLRQISLNIHNFMEDKVSLASVLLF